MMPDNGVCSAVVGVGVGTGDGDNNWVEYDRGGTNGSETEGGKMRSGFSKGSATTNNLTNITSPKISLTLVQTKHYKIERHNILLRKLYLSLQYILWT